MEKYTIQSGDTLDAISKKYKISIQEILQANPKITNPDRINVGDTIIIPAQNKQTTKVVQRPSITNSGINGSRIHRNDSPTQAYSEQLEDLVHERQNGLINVGAKKGRTEPYYVYYQHDNEIRVPGTGRVSKNILDTLALHAIKTNFNAFTALGLSSKETAFGASPLNSVDKYKKDYFAKYGRNPSPEEIKAYERASMNASYIRNFGRAPVSSIVNNHAYFQNAYPVYSSIQHPLDYAYKMFEDGRYNPGNPSHTDIVINEGKRLEKLPVIIDWWNNSFLPKYGEEIMTYSPWQYRKLK